ncbi:MAG TPA: DoxX family protein, partial [Magnetospirillaceae bacterium]|nr:DoxX family protein [Magnetospirillaceae bacterium]
PASTALLIGVVEFFGGLMLAAGFATRIAAGFVTGMMLVAVLKVHLPNGFFWTDGGYEYPLLWGLLSFSYVIRGAGRKSIDAWIGWEV